MTLSAHYDIELMEHPHEDMRGCAEHDADDWIESDHDLLNKERWTVDEFLVMFQ